MKTLRQVCAATILSLTCAVSVFAGDIYCPGVVAPDPPPPVTAIVVVIVGGIY